MKTAQLIFIFVISIGLLFCAENPGSKLKQVDQGTTEPAAQPAATPSACLEERVQGKCKAMFEVFGYDAGLGKCVPYIYGGCEGTANKFDSMAACEAACSTK